MLIFLALVCGQITQDWTNTAAEPIPQGAGIVTMQSSATAASLRGLSVVDSRTAWCSGTEGTVLRTLDGGKTWQDVRIASAADADVRDIQAFSPMRAVALVVGSPARFFHTVDGGKHWSLTYQNDHPDIFFDAMAFWDDGRGLALSDPIDGRFLLIETLDEGASWRPLDRKFLPVARQGEAGFAASGTCMTVLPGSRAWIGTGGRVPSPETARVLWSDNFGGSWTASETPLASAASRGIFSIVMLDAQRGVAVGGDYQQPDLTSDNVLITEDGGRAWHVPRGPKPRGYRSAVATTRVGHKPVVVTVGPTGMDYSLDFGENWLALSDLGAHTVAFAAGEPTGWASGANGRVLRIDLRRLPELSSTSDATTGQ